jgi:hypothetical protein
VLLLFWMHIDCTNPTLGTEGFFLLLPIVRHAAGDKVADTHFGLLSRVHTHVMFWPHLREEWVCKACFCPAHLIIVLAAACCFMRIR